MQKRAVGSLRHTAKAPSENIMLIIGQAKTTEKSKEKKNNTPKTTKKPQN
jgi:hypothetical protein